MDVRKILAEVKAHGQGHVLAFWDALSTEERGRLAAQLAALDWELLERLTRRLRSPGIHPPEEDLAAQATAFEPAPVLPMPRTAQAKREAEEARAAGEAALRAGRIGCFLVAGGQGTRLGFDGPKGVFPVGPISGRSLFQLHAEKILALRQRHGARIPWAVMTSAANDAATRAFFQEKDFFGLAAESVRFLQQDDLPAVDRNGKLLLASRSSLALSPNGHGGAIKALHDSGTLAWMREQGVDTLFYFQVDNPLVRICDPLFLGRHLEARAEMSTKVVRKRGWEERVGVLGRINGKLGVIEYSDLPEELARAKSPDGTLMFWAGNIAVHVLDTAFVERLNRAGFQLPYHQAAKTVPCLGPGGKPLKLQAGEKNALKFETFVFDALAQARAALNLEVCREEEFAPIKNALGADSPETARALLQACYVQWLEAAGIRVPRRTGGALDCRIEISPLTSLDGEGLSARAGPAIRPGADVLL